VGDGEGAGVGAGAGAGFATGVWTCVALGAVVGAPGVIDELQDDSAPASRTTTVKRVVALMCAAQRQRAHHLRSWAIAGFLGDFVRSLWFQ